jgi:hypothetical protein
LLPALPIAPPALPLFPALLPPKLELRPALSGSPSAPLEANWLSATGTPLSIAVAQAQ